MATYTIYGDTADGEVRSDSATYSTARSGNNLTASNPANFILVGQGLISTTYYLYQGFFSFDTSSIGGVPTSATLEMTQDPVVYTIGGDETVNARIYDWGASVDTGDWVAGASISGTLIATMVIPPGSFVSATTRTFTSQTADFLANLGNPLRYRLTTAEFEAGTAPTGTRQTRIAFRPADYSGTSNDPKLTVVTDDSSIFANMAPRIAPERME